MTGEMSQFKATANSHMRRDMETGRKWNCACEACREIRALTGMDKTLKVRPLVREIVDIENRLQEANNEFEMQSLRERYCKLYDELADAMAE